MNSKLVKWLIISLVLILILMWLLLQSQPKQKPLTNTVSKVGSEKANFYQKKSVNLPHINATEINPSNTINYNDGDSERSYLTIYKEIELAKSCDHFFQKHHQAKGEYDYILKLNQAAYPQSINQKGADEVQKQALENFISACLTLKATVFQRAQITNEFPPYQFAYPVLVELRKEFKLSKPETQEEKHLAKSLSQASQWQPALDKLIEVLRGEPKLDKTLRDMLISEARSITERINDMYQSNQLIDPVEIQRLEHQINALYKQTAERLPVDEVKKSQAMAAFMPVNFQLEQMLMTTYPESFKAVVQKLQFRNRFDLSASDETNNQWLTFINRIMPWYQPPSDVIQGYAQIDDNQVFDLLIEPAGLLYLCFLGDDCSAESSHVRHYCLGKDNYHAENYSSACGKTLIDFFTEDYLSANQWQDVSALFDVMVATYAP